MEGGREGERREKKPERMSKNELEMGRKLWPTGRCISQPTIYYIAKHI